jgi:hypothetical protein
MAAEGILSGAVKASGMIGVGAAITGDRDRWRPLIDQTPRQEIRVYFIIGDQDARFYQPTLLLAELLREKQMGCAVKSYAGMGHVYPPDFEAVVTEALQFVVP